MSMMELKWTRLPQHSLKNETEEDKKSTQTSLEVWKGADFDKVEQ